MASDTTSAAGAGDVAGTLEAPADVRAFETFDEMELKEELLRGIYGYGYERPSQIQQRAIVPILKGHDVVAQAHSGTGKTATFTISMLQKIDPAENACQALVLAPTRELAQQIQTVVSAIGEHLHVTVQACVGGTDVRSDVMALRRGAHVVIGTPGRVYDLIRRDVLKTNKLKLVVLDEADQMLDKGFKEQIFDIFTAGMPSTAQVALFSATMPADVLELTEKFMQSPVKILIKKEQLTLEGIRQYFVVLDDETQKLECLCDLYTRLTITQALIYCNRKERVEWLARQLHDRDFGVSAIHGSMEQEEREKVIREFRAGATRVLIATDLLARGLDVQQVSLVINYDMPTNRENYIHRIGRSGRYGRKGASINLLVGPEVVAQKDIEEFYRTHIEPLPADLSKLY